VTSISPYYKSVVGGLVAGLTSLATAAADNSITASEWVLTALSFAVGLGAVYAIPNTPVGDHEAGE
jgi:hypothetical protein